MAIQIDIEDLELFIDDNQYNIIEPDGMFTTASVTEEGLNQLNDCDVTFKIIEK